jgi:hypothetical protein
MAIEFAFKYHRLPFIAAKRYIHLALCLTSEEGNMTPEELNRTIEFIIQSQARLAAAQEQARVDRLKSEEEGKAFDKRLAGLLEIQVQLLENQTRRMDDFQRESEAAQKRHEETHRQMREEFWAFMRETSDWREESLRRLDLILEKLVNRPN